jgi:hypothetical protein
VANPIRHRPQPWNRLPADRSLTGFDSLNWCPWASFTDWSQGRLLGPEPGRGHVPPFLEDSASRLVATTSRVVRYASLNYSYRRGGGRRVKSQLVV